MRRKALAFALALASFICVLLASLGWASYQVDGSDNTQLLWIIGTIFAGLEFLLDIFLLLRIEDYDLIEENHFLVVLERLLFFLQTIAIWIAVIWLYEDSSAKIPVWAMIGINLIKFIIGLFIIYLDIRLAHNLRSAHQLSQPPNLLANPLDAPTHLPPNEDVEQPPLYEEYLAQDNDLPPKYEDLDHPPPSYQEYLDQQTQETFL